MASDLPIFFEHQRDPDGTVMAAFPPRDGPGFNAHWSRLLADENVIKKTILFHGEVAGNILCFEHAGKLEVGYWIGKEYWRKGVTTTALSEFLRQVSMRPLYAHVARHNVASIRVLEKCGFSLIDEDKEFSAATPGLILRLP